MTTVPERRRHLAAELRELDEQSPGADEAVKAAADRVLDLVNEGWKLDKATAHVQAHSSLGPRAWRLVMFVCAEGAAELYAADP